MSPARQLQLEQMVDAHGLEDVLASLATICAEKADHIRATYNDKPLADSWNHCGHFCHHAASSSIIHHTSPSRA